MRSGAQAGPGANRRRFRRRPGLCHAAPRSARPPAPQQRRAHGRLAAVGARWDTGGSSATPCPGPPFRVMARLCSLQVGLWRVVAVAPPCPGVRVVARCPAATGDSPPSFSAPPTASPLKVGMRARCASGAAQPGRSGSGDEGSAESGAGPHPQPSAGVRALSATSCIAAAAPDRRATAAALLGRWRAQSRAPPPGPSLEPPPDLRLPSWVLPIALPHSRPPGLLNRLLRCRRPGRGGTRHRSPARWQPPLAAAGDHFPADLLFSPYPWRTAPPVGTPRRAPPC